MSATKVAIELMSDHMDVVTIRSGRTIAGRRIPIALPSEPTAWAKAVRDCGPKLKEAVAELGAAGRSTRIVYRSPTQAVDLASFELRSSNQACVAAKLPCVEALPYSATSAICHAAPVGRDRGAKGRWHIVVAADRMDVIRAMVETVEAAGLKFTSATPLDAAMMARLVRRALSHGGPQHGWLHFGKHNSFFVLGGQGVVRFERSISLGVETIVQSLTRPIRMPDRDEPIELEHDTAKAILHNHGIPDSDEPVHEEYGLTSREIMPTIQPVLQRYVVELRQSLRFGLPESERESIAITVSGPGSCIPGLAELIAWELKLQFSPDPAYAEYAYNDPATAKSEMLDALERPGFLDQLNLQPAESARRRQTARLRRWLWAGASATLVMIGADGLRFGAILAKASARESALATQVAGFESLRKTHQTLAAALVEMSVLERTIVDEVGLRPNLGAVLHELSRLTPESIRLTSIRFSREDEGMLVRLYGRALQVATKTGKATELEPYIESLKGSPLIQTAELRNVEVGLLGPSEGQRFEASFTLILAPDEAPVAVVEGETRP